MTRIAVKRMTDEEQDELFRTIRWSYLQHNELLKLHQKPRFKRAQLLVNQGLAMRLGPFDETHLPDLQINLEPRVKYDLPNIAKAEMNICPPLGQISSEFTETLNAE